jgi:RNA polymerase sigma factor (sigma-70 family)
VPRAQAVSLANLRQGSDDSAAPDSWQPQAPEDERLDRWCAFHEAVALLPPEQREVVGLIFYHGWSQGEVAEVLQVTPRTVRRWWAAAMVTVRYHWKDDDL